MAMPTRSLRCLGFLAGAACAFETKVPRDAPGDRRAPPPFLPGALENLNSAEEHKIGIDYNVTWEGWGTAMAWWANVFGEDPKLADLTWTLNRSINFGPTLELQNLPGLGLNVARYNVGGSVGAWRGGVDDTPGSIVRDGETITQDISNTVDYKRAQGFWLDPANRDPDSSAWNWEADPRQVTQLKMAKDRGVNLMELFSNSPMWWMTKSLNTAGTVEERGENLLNESIPDLVYYFGQVAKRFKEVHGINFHTISPFNEPRGNVDWCWWNAGASNTGQEGNCMYVAQQKMVVEALHDELQRIGLSDVWISASEENTFDMGGFTYDDFGDTISKVQQVNVHGYQRFWGDRQGLGEMVQADGKVLWMSEFCDSDWWPETTHGPPADTKSNGMVMANCIHYDFQMLGGMSSWSYWQILDQTEGWGLFKFGNSAEEGWWGENKSNIHVEPKFWVFAHFTRHIRPGMVILSQDSFSGNAGAHTVAAYSKAMKKLVLVTTNFAGERAVTYDLSDFARVAGTGGSWVTHTDGSKTYENPPDFGSWKVPASKRFTSQFAPFSVKSFEIHDVCLEACEEDAAWRGGPGSVLHWASLVVLGVVASMLA